jgi:hypothetical protein
MVGNLLCLLKMSSNYQLPILLLGKRNGVRPL